MEPEGAVGAGTLINEKRTSAEGRTKGGRMRHTLLSIVIIISMVLFANTVSATSIAFSYKALCDIKPLNQTHAEIIKCQAYNVYSGWGSCDIIEKETGPMPVPGTIVGISNDFETNTPVRMDALVYSPTNLRFTKTVSESKELADAAMEMCELELQRTKEAASQRRIADIITSVILLLPAIGIILSLLKSKPDRIGFFSPNKAKVSIAVLLLLIGLLAAGGLLSYPPLTLPMTTSILLAYAILFLPPLIVSAAISSIIPQVAIIIFVSLFVLYTYLLASLLMYIKYRIKTRK